MHRTERWMFPAALWCLLIVQSVAVHAQQLTIQNEDGKQTILSRADLEALAHVKVQAFAHDVSASFEGVALKSVLEKAGVGFGETLRGKRLASFVIAEAADGYRVVFALAEMDPAFTDKQIVLAFLKDGKPLDEKEGPYRIVIPDEKTGALDPATHRAKNSERAMIRLRSDAGSIFLNHDLGRLHDGNDGVTLLELQFIGASARDRALDQVIADTNRHVGHNVAELNFFDGSPQFVSG